MRCAAFTDPPRSCPTARRYTCRDAHALGVAQHRRIPGMRRQHLFEIDDVLELVQKQHVDLGGVADGGPGPRLGGSARRWRTAGRRCPPHIAQRSSAAVLKLGLCRWHTPISRVRMALSRLSSMVRPTLITSPVAFIWVESRFEAVANLSNGKRAILVTT